MRPLRSRLVLSGLMVAGVASGCAMLRPAAHAALAPRVRTASTVVMLHGAPLELHLAVPLVPATPRPLVLYASGDGGWFGAAIDMFRTIAGDGYPTAGFSSRAFLKIERPSHVPFGAAQLAVDYAAILFEARRALALAPQSPAVLSGWSRGAAFAAVVGSEPLLRDDLRGVVAIGLGAAEDLTIDGPSDETDDGGDAPATGRWGTLLPYRRLHQMGPVPCAVIQSTGDGYLSAARAQALFGPDTSHRRFYAVPARNHRFSGGRAQFAAALGSALAWVVDSGRPLS